MIVENILREKGLLLSGSKSFTRFFTEENQTPAGNMKCFDSASSYAAQRMLMDLPTPSKPRRDTSSAQVSAAISNGSGILKKRLWCGMLTCHSKLHSHKKVDITHL